MAGDGDDPGAPWWRSALLYQVYLRSFADGDGDGVGDLPGLLGHLDHLHWLGVGAIWLSPVTVSPDADWGYDVADYRAVQPALGTMADLDALIERARRLGMRVLLDLVPNHTSIRHPWFVDARSSRQARHRRWYVWADPGAGGGPPNNWVSSCGGPAWTWDDASGQYYLHNHLPEQPDLDWWNAEVADAFDDVVRFWLDRGVAGFRIDVCNLVVKDRELRDNPPATDEDDLDVQLLGQRPLYNGNRPEVHDVIRRWRAVTDAYEGSRVLVGETPVPVDALAAYYGHGDELHLAFNFPFISAPFEAGALARVVADTERMLPAGAWPVWTGSNHDMGRLASRWAGGDPDRVRLALMLVLCLRGTPVLYQGDEIGLEDGEVAPPWLRDPLGLRYWPAYAGRDGARTPMPWHAGPGGGFCPPEVTPWLPLTDPGRANVADQRADPRSALHLTRDLAALRGASADLSAGDYRQVETPDGVWAWRRGARTWVALNLTDDLRRLDAPAGQVLVGTDRGRDGTRFDGRLGPWEGVVGTA